MILRNLLILAIIGMNVGGCIARNKHKTVENITQAPLKEVGIANCKIDSSSYSAPYLKHSGKLTPVPISDGLLVSIDATKHPEMQVLIKNKKVFRSCYKSSMVIKTNDQARKILKFTGIKDFERFIGAELVVCTTVDEGWFFFYKKPIGYVGYTGPTELPLSVVGMLCN